MNGTDAINQMRARGYAMAGEIDEAAVAQWVADAGQAPTAQRIAMGERIVREILAGRNPFGNAMINFPTLAAIGDMLLS